MWYIGADVHKDNITICALSPEGKVKFEKDFVKTDDSWSVLTELTNEIKGQECCAMMESGTYAYLPYRFLSKNGIETHVVHARGLKIITESDKKTDKKDALSIARMLRLWKKGEIELQMAFMPNEKQCELKDICRYREDISKKISDETRKIKSHMARNCYVLPEKFKNFQTAKSRKYVLDNYPNDFTLIGRMNCLNDLFRERNRVQKEIEKRLPDSKEVKLLAEIPGIGKQTAVQIMSMIIDIERFESAEKICAYFGMVPKTNNSGGKERHGKMTKNGDKMMRSIMERVTESHILHCDSSITSFYNRLVPSKGKKKALITASAKMLKVIWSVLKRGTPFRAETSS